jgi:transketolase
MLSEDVRRINTIRFLSVDMVEKAKSGHPGLPLGAAPMAYILWDRFLRHDPKDPSWADRDRFVLSAGHGSAMLYSLLHLYGYDLPIEQLQQFRQYGSRTPGHPESGRTSGVEVTTGPLGQGFAMAVGLALAEHYLETRFNRPEFPIVRHTTYALCSDGDIMEGIASEAASLAGHLGVAKLVMLYDDNKVSLEGPTSLALSENVDERFRAYGWNVTSVEDGNDLPAIEGALHNAVDRPERPWLIRVRTHIGYGSPKQDTYQAHGEPLGPDATRATKQKLGWPLEPPFLVPDDVREYFRQGAARGAQRSAEWRSLFDRYRSQYADLAHEFERMMQGRPPAAWTEGLPTYREGSVATRDASSQAMQVLAGRWPELLGGSGDLSPSTKTYLEGLGDFSFKGECGRNLHFGVRENTMVGIVNGMAAHGGLRPYGASFLVFSDYCRPTIRMSSIMQVPSTLVFTHDSIGLGEDGPTHQPVEHLASLRAIPGYTVLRPADANETVEAWQITLERRRPTALVLTRQKIPVLDPAKYPSVPGGVHRGAYVLDDAEGGAPEVILIGTGSEVQLCLSAKAQLASKGVRSRVVSLPSWELFEEQEASYRDTVFPPGVPRVVVEAASPVGWERYAGPGGAIIGLDRFGASGPGATVLKELGFTPERVVAAAMDVRAKHARAGST